MTVQAAKKISDWAGSDIVPCCISLGLYINTVKPKSVLVHYSVNTIITRTTKSTARVIGARTAITQAEKQVHDKPFEKLRRRCANAFKQVFEQARRRFASGCAA